MDTSWCGSRHLLLFPLLLLIVLLPVLVFSATPLTAGDDAYLRCNNGSIAECNGEDEVLLMESEIARRFLEERKRYISYGAVGQDQPTCGGAANGQAYTRSGSCMQPPSNPQTRPCYKYYRCRTGDY